MKNLSLNYQKLTREQMKKISGGYVPDCHIIGFCDATTECDPECYCQDMEIEGQHTYTCIDKNQ